MSESTTKSQMSGQPAMLRAADVSTTASARENKNGPEVDTGTCFRSIYEAQHKGKGNVTCKEMITRQEHERFPADWQKECCHAAIPEKIS